MVATSFPIFVIDDDDLVRDAIRKLLKIAGFKVEVFESAEAFLISGSHKKDGVLVLDVRMSGMNGLELQRYLADSGNANPIVFITAFEDKQARNEALSAGAVAYLKKPFEDQLLFEAIDHALKR